MNELDLFTQAMGIPDQHARQDFLNKACEGNSGLKQRLDKLLSAFHKADQVLPDVDSPPSGSISGDSNKERCDYHSGMVIAGKYKLLEEIGVGGMGTVFLAEQFEPVKRKVAIKLINPGMDSKRILARFEAERQALALMDHPNIAKVLDAGLTNEQRPYFVMEYIRGIPMTKFCDNEKVPIEDRLKLFIPVCHAVQHAHQKGIIHRDLKPTNILVGLYDGKPIPKVIDFGLAKALHQNLTELTLHTGHDMVIGTPMYMSPEQAELNNLDIDTRTDIYSLGVILYELLTGVTPLEKKRFKEAAWNEIIRIIKEEEPSKPSTKISKAESLPSVAAQRHTEPKKLSILLRGDLDWIAMKALSKERERRYETANGFAMDIQRYLANEPVSASPPSAIYRMRKFIQRNRIQVIAATLVLMALVAGMIGTSWGMYEARQSAAREKAAKELTEKRLGQIKNGVILFSDMLTGINPRFEESQGKPLYEQLRERAEQAAAQLQEGTVSDPLTESYLQVRLGTTLRELGSYAKSVEILEKAKKTRIRELGPDHMDTLNVQDELAYAYQLSGRNSDAVAEFKQTLDQKNTSLGGEHLQTLKSRVGLAGMYRILQKFDEAIPLLENSLEILQRQAKPNDHLTLNIMAELGCAYRDTRQTAKSIEISEKSVALQKKVHGEDHYDTLHAMNNLAGAYNQAGRSEEAIVMFERIRNANSRLLGPDHPKTLQSINNLATCYWSMSRLDRSISLFEGIVPKMEKRLGRKHPETLVLIGNLGSNYMEAGRFSEAIPRLEECYKEIDLHPVLRFTAPCLVNCYSKTGRDKEAIQLAKDYIAKIRPQIPKNSPQLADDVMGIGMSLIENKHFQEAEPLLREALTIRESKGTDSWRIFLNRSLLGGVLLNQKKFAEAEPLLLQGYEGMLARKQSMQKIHQSQLDDGLKRLIQLYTETNKPEELKKWQTEKEKYTKPVERK